MLEVNMYGDLDRDLNPLKVIDYFGLAQKSNADVYLRRSNAMGEHLCFCNFCNMDSAEKLSRKIQMLSEFEIEIKEQNSTNALSEPLIGLYTRLEKQFDATLITLYFSESALRLYYIINLANTIAESIPRPVKYFEGTQIDGFNCHFSHLWAFLNTLNRRQLNSVYDILKNEKKEYQYFMLNNQDIKTKWDIANQTLVENIQKNFLLIQRLIYNQKINFFSPYSMSEIANQVSMHGWASTEHAAAFSDKNSLDFVTKNPTLITAKWYVNIIYEKLTLMKLSLFDKSIMNYIVGSSHVDINNEIERLIEKKPNY
ncbi:hypothetical protein [Levilactobacillus brevis]|uniref:hypothetical protein n=1 Tax=Levilactobacillus brevis TaxID=1580 RepID=UPI0021A2A962|nr:hypothetical protein [Levilactobacillus brevis]